MQRRPPALRATVDERVPLQQQPAHVHAAEVRRQVERGLALVVEDVDAGVVLAEDVRDLEVTARGGDAERGPAGGRLLVDGELDLAVGHLGEDGGEDVAVAGGGRVVDGGLLETRSWHQRCARSSA